MIASFLSNMIAVTPLGVVGIILKGNPLAFSGRVSLLPVWLNVTGILFVFGLAGIAAGITAVVAERQERRRFGMISLMGVFGTVVGLKAAAIGYLLTRLGP